MKTLPELLDEVRGGGIKVQYSSDYKIAPDGRKVRAHRIEVGKKVEEPSVAPGVGDDVSNDTENIYQKYLEKYNKQIKQSQRKEIKENTNQEQPPYILVLKRQNVRQFPGGIGVALYYNEKLGKHFSVPYGKTMDSSIQAENTIDTSESLEEKELIIKFLNTFSKLTEENQQKMLEMVNEDYQKIKDFTIGTK